MDYKLLEALVIIIVAIFIVSAYNIQSILKRRYPEELKKLLSSLPEEKRSMGSLLILIVFHNKKTPDGYFLRHFVWMYRIAALVLIAMIVYLLAN